MKKPKHFLRDPKILEYARKASNAECNEAMYVFGSQLTLDKRLVIAELVRLHENTEETLLALAQAADEDPSPILYPRKHAKNVALLIEGLCRMYNHVRTVHLN